MGDNCATPWPALLREERRRELGATVGVGAGLGAGLGGGAGVGLAGLSGLGIAGGDRERGTGRLALGLAVGVTGG